MKPVPLTLPVNSETAVLSWWIIYEIAGGGIILAAVQEGESLLNTLLRTRFGWNVPT